VEIPVSPVRIAFLTAALCVMICSGCSDDETASAGTESSFKAGDESDMYPMCQGWFLTNVKFTLLIIGYIVSLFMALATTTTYTALTL
jgi:hypothetical protein